MSQLPSVMGVGVTDLQSHWQMMVLQKCAHPSPGNHEYVTLRDKRDFVGEIKWRILSMEVILGYLVGPM